MTFHELMKNFNHLRDYMREFFIYGYKTRNGYQQKSPRTYDNERRRIKSYLHGFIRWRYGKGGKYVFVSIDSAKIPQNPFYQAYKSKSFTNNDIILHFLILDLLMDGSAQTASQITDGLMTAYQQCFEQQTVRLKLREYVEAGLLSAEKRGRSLYYCKVPMTLTDWLPQTEMVYDFLTFFSEIAPFSVIGSYLMDRCQHTNQRVSFKHHFLVHCLDDTILLPLIQAMAKDQLVQIKNFSNRSQTEVTLIGLPIRIMTSVQTGRRYVIFYQYDSRSFLSLRLDYIKSVACGAHCPTSGDIRQLAETYLQQTWGVSISNKASLEHLRMILYIDEQTEDYVRHRLEREKRNGSVTRLASNLFCFEILVQDANELMSWIKTFIGRIVRLESDNQAVVDRFYQDLERMYQLYEVTI